MRVGVEGELCGGGGGGAMGAEGGVGGVCSWYVTFFFFLVERGEEGGGREGADGVWVGSYVLYTHMMRQRRKVMRGKEVEGGR